MIRKFILAALLLCAPSVYAQGTISAMTAASALSGTELFECVQSGSKKCTAAQIKTFTSASPTLVTPNLGTPSAGVLTNTTGYTVGALSGAGTGVLTALGVNIGSAGAPILFNGAGGTPSSLTCTNCTGTAAGLTAGTVTTNANLTGDVTSSGNATTLATVNSNVGSFTNSSITVNGKGLITAASSGAAGAILGANTFTALQTITQATANAGIIASTGYSLTGSDATGMVNLAGTINTSGSPDIFKIAITDTNRGATTKFLNIYGGASGTTSVFSVDRSGSLALGSSGNGIIFPTADNIWIEPATRAAVIFSSTGGINWTSSSASAGSSNLYLRSGGAATLQQGAADVAGAPVAQFTRVQSASGVSNTAGADWTLQASAGTGSAAGGAFIVQVAPASGSASTKNAYTNALKISTTALTLSTVVAPASSGTRYLCIDTGGVVTSSASACSGT